MSFDRSYPDGTRISTIEQDDGLKEMRLHAGETQVSRTLIIPLQMRLGQSVLRMDGIGGVETNEEHRNRGYSRRVLESAVEVMRAGDAAITTLYGIPNYYPKFGYATSGPEYTIVLPVADESPDPRGLPDGWQVRPFEAADLPSVQRLYEERTREATGAIDRGRTVDSAADRVSRAAWDRLLNPDTRYPDDCRVVTDGSGEVVAYAWRGRSGWWVHGREEHAPGSFHVGEVLANGPLAADAITFACREWAKEVAADCDDVELIIPAGGPVAHAAALRGGAFVNRYSMEGEFMARVLDPARLFQQMLPEVSHLVSKARLGFEGTLVFETDEGSVALGLGAEGVTLEPEASGKRLVFPIPQAELARLVMGGFEAREVAALLPTPVDPGVVSLLEVLFPRRSPHVYAMDRF